MCRNGYAAKLFGGLVIKQGFVKRGFVSCRHTPLAMGTARALSHLLGGGSKILETTPALATLRLKDIAALVNQNWNSYGPRLKKASSNLADLS